ncbi:hypothetical protein M407DRAFT_32676 [Tulasnella calospora MUT 4182]|uniref:Uncharacterized protein n=1 Tax=Tulasnella calospora MUT 4182 TaxID=1051891 RepID=A0A0C3PSE6_9AGAM|nr:hypothetical protein M407DRAFT_32676 [Tulasnella calospora MUT 4182]
MSFRVRTQFRLGTEGRGISKDNRERCSFGWRDGMRRAAPVGNVIASSAGTDQPGEEVTTQNVVYWRIFINERGNEIQPAEVFLILPPSPIAFGSSSQSTPASIAVLTTSIDINPVFFHITMMVSSTATRGGDSFAVDVASAVTTTLQAPQPLPPSGFVSCPTQHGLGRSNDENLLQAIVRSISYRLEKLSLSDEPVLESHTTAECYPVYTATPAGTDPTPSKHSARPSLRNIKPRLLGKLSNGLKAGLQKSIRKRANTKKTRTLIPPLPVSPCPPVEHEETLIGQTVESRSGLLLSGALEANLDSRDPPFQLLFAFAARAPPTHETVNTTFLQPGSSDASPVADDSMDEDRQQPPLARPESPVPMELEAMSPSSDAIMVPEFPSVPSKDSTSEDTPTSIPEPRDELMRDEEQCSSDSEDADPMESADTMITDVPTAESASSTLPSREIDMDDAADLKGPSPVQRETTSFVQPTQTPPASDKRSQLPMPDTNPGPDSVPVNSANVPASELPPPSAQTLPTVRLYKAAESSSAVGDSRNIRPASTQRQVPLIESTESTATSTAGASPTSTAVDEVVASSTQATKSAAGPSTPTPASSQMNPTEAQEQVPNAHSSHVHKAHFPS